MRARNPNRRFSPAFFHWNDNFNIPVFAQRLVELRNLVPFRQVRIKILLPIKLAHLADFTIQRDTNLHAFLHNLFAQFRVRPGMSHAYRTNLRVRVRAVRILTPAKRLRFRLQLHVRFDTNRRFELSVRIDREIFGIVD